MLFCCSIMLTELYEVEVVCLPPVRLNIANKIICLGDRGRAALKKARHMD